MPASFCLALRTISQRVTMLTPSKRSVESLHLLRSSPGPESNWISMEETVLVPPGITSAASLLQHLKVCLLAPYSPASSKEMRQ
jgi:hypothetical protein